MFCKTDYWVHIVVDLFSFWGGLQNFGILAVDGSFVLVHILPVLSESIDSMITLCFPISSVRINVALLAFEFRN